MRRGVPVLAAALSLSCAPPRGAKPAGETPPPPAGTPPAAPSCRDAWAHLPAPRRTYDFATDAIRTAQGNEGYQAFSERLPRRACRKAWTVLIAMAADNDDMPPYAYWHLNEMEAAFNDPGRSAASTIDADVIVELDLDAPPGIRRLHMFRAPVAYAPDAVFPSGLRAELAERTPADIQSPVITLLDEEETIPPAESLKRFLSWGVEAYPSERYLVVVWGHGLGWRPAGLDRNQYAPGDLRGGIAFDHSQGTVLDTPGLHGALAAASRTELAGRPFDIYASDACLMQSLEVAAELTPVSRYIVGSEQIEDYLGFPYRTFLPRLNGTAAPLPSPPGCAERDSACRAAALLPALQREAFAEGGLYARASPEASETFTLSALDTAALEGALRPALGELSGAIAAYVREEPLRRIDLQVLLDVPRTVSGPGHGTPGFLGGTRDLGVFLSGLRASVQEDAELSPEGLSPAAARLARAVDATEAALHRTVLAAAFGARYQTERYAGMAGVSVWLPHNGPELERRIDFFASSRLYALPRPGAIAWQSWLEAVFSTTGVGD